MVCPNSVFDYPTGLAVYFPAYLFLVDPGLPSILDRSSSCLVSPVKHRVHVHGSPALIGSYLAPLQIGADDVAQHSVIGPCWESVFTTKINLHLHFAVSKVDSGPTRTPIVLYSLQNTRGQLVRLQIIVGNSANFAEK